MVAKNALSPGDIMSFLDPPPSTPIPVPNQLTHVNSKNPTLPFSQFWGSFLKFGVQLTLAAILIQICGPGN